MHLTILIIVVAIMFLIFIWAMIEWGKAFVRLTKVEFVELEIHEKAAKPTSLNDVIDRLNRFNQYSVANNELKRAVLNGRYDPENLEIYDWIHWSKYVAGIFVFVGLLGTVYGIASGVTELSSTVNTTSDLVNNSFSQANFEKLLAGISRLMSGILLASYCTLAGIFFTILLSIFNSNFIKLCRDFAQRLGKIAYFDILSITSKTAIDVNEQKYIKGLETAIKSLNSTTIKLTDGFESAVGNLNGTTDKLSDNILTVSQDFLKISENTQKLVTNVNVVSNRTDQVIFALNKTILELQEENKNSSDSTVNTIQNLQNMLEQSHEFLTSHSKNIAELNLGVKDNTIRLITSIGDLTTQVGVLSDSVAPISGDSQAVKDSAFRMEEAVRSLKVDLIDSSRGQNSHLEEFVKKVSKTNDTLALLLNRFEITLADTMSHIDAATPLQERIAEMVTMIDLLADELKNIDKGKNLDIISGVSNGIKNELKQSLALQEVEQLNKLSDMMNKLNQNGSQVITDFIQTMNTESAVQLKAEIEKLNEQVRNELSKLKFDLTPKKSVFRNWWEKLIRRGNK